MQTVTQETADIRNLLVADIADRFFIPYLTPGGNLDRLLHSGQLAGKPILTLDLPENRPLLAQGATVFQSGGMLGQWVRPQ